MSRRAAPGAGVTIPALRARLRPVAALAARLSPPPARLRVAVYAAVVIGVGAATCLHRLGGGMLTGDEAYFAFTTEHMRATGDYVVPSIGRPQPHLNAAPLYNWLCRLTPDCDDGNLRYRGWSAVFGVGCGLAALLLGAVLFGPEAGLLAGLFVVTNLHFLFEAGARTGTMNTALAFFVTSATACYAKSRSAPGAGLWWWAGAGACLGLAALTKPPVVAGFFAAALSAHHLAARRDLPWTRRLAGPLAAAAVAAAVALPWYAAVYARLGTDGLERLVVYNSVGRAAAAVYGGATPEPWWFYGRAAWESSDAFKAAGPAVAFGWACVAIGRRRFAWGLAGWLAGAFAVAISASAEKHAWYAYPAYPLLAVMIAGFLLAGFDRPPGPEGRCRRRARRAAAVAGVAFAAVVLARDFTLARAATRLPRLGYPPLSLHRAAEPELAAGRARLVLYDFPRGVGNLDRRLGFVPADRTYGFLLPRAAVVRSAAELDALLADGTPAAVFLPPNLPPDRLGLNRVPDARLAVRSDLRTYPLLVFNGGAAAFRLGALPGATPWPSGESGSE